MAPASHLHQSYEYLDALLTAIPNDSISPEITASPSRDHPHSKFIDTALRLASGGPARPDHAPHIRDAWPELQTSVQRALHALHPSTSTSSSSQQPTTKRKLSPSLPSTNNNNNKKPKYEDAGDDKDDGDGDDAPQLTLHAISATAPVRHKVDITVHVHTLRLAHSTTGAPTARCTRIALTRVFLLPTRARSSGALQWTALLLAGDKPPPPAPRGSGAAAKEAKKAVAHARFELVCSVPDSSNPSTIPRVTVHSPTPTSSSSSVPASSSHNAFLTLLSSTIAGTPLTLTTVERGAPLAGITAFRGVRETSLWFFDNGANARAGILADGRPAEFWALADLARGEAGVRVRTVTGKTCSVVLMRRGGSSGSDGTDERNGDGEEEEEEEGEETEFQMIDGKEREGILEWVRRHRGAFGIAKVLEGEKVNGNGKVMRTAETGTETETGKDGGEDSDSDSDFEVSGGESDGGSPSSSGSGSGSDTGEDEDEDEGDEDGSESGGESDDENNPKHHPLLRAGALPKMSRAAMDAAVGLVVGDLTGQGQALPGRDPPGPAASGLGLAHPLAGRGDEEEDELEG
jgi:histone chaperone Rttp106-like protein